MQRSTWYDKGLQKIRTKLKPIAVGISIAIVSLAITLIGVKAYFGDSATERPGEEKMEKSLHIQESKKVEKAGEAGEAGELGKNLE